jgi:hypothetical protein
MASNLSTGMSVMCVTLGKDIFSEKCLLKNIPLAVIDLSNKASAFRPVKLACSTARKDYHSLSKFIIAPA